MAELKNLKRPNLATIKLVESIGILLNIPKTTEKSAYKAEVPSNYDDTVDRLDADFNAELNYLSNLRSADINNQVASQFFNKTLEPGFSYEAAINSGGLLTRELFNVMMHIYIRLQSDGNRLPINEQTISVLVDGSRCSYVAFDTACHIQNHGLLNIIVYTSNTSSDQDEPGENNSILYRDLVRRCKQHFKLQEHCYNTIEVSRESGREEKQMKQILAESNSNIFVLGLDDGNIGESSRAKMILWAVWEYENDVVLSKGLSMVRPFTTVHFPRKILLYVDSKVNTKSTFLKALKFIRPGDTAVVLSIVDHRDPVGDCDGDTRYDFGDKTVWSAVSDPPLDDHTFSSPDCVGWNDAAVEALQNSLNGMLNDSLLSGRAEIKMGDKYSYSQIICDTALSESASMIIMGCSLADKEKDTVIDCVQEATVSLVLLK